MKTTEQKIVFALRVLISGLFLLSAFAKLYPTPMYGITKVFEQGQLIPMGLPESIVPYFSRFIIGAEIFLAITILLNNYLNRLIVPLSFIMVAIFSIHLSTQIFGDSENCGCFGDLIPMTPLEALIKNVITLIILAFIYKRSDYVNKKLSNVFILFLIISTSMFALLPISNQAKSLVGNSSSDEFLLYVDDLEFNKSIGPKILCFFDPDCDHCQHTARSLDSLRVIDNKFPPIHIVFSDIDNLIDTVNTELNARIDNFFTVAGSNFSYQTMPQYNYDTEEVDSYMEITFPEYDNPVVILYDGNRQIKLFHGTSDKEYSASELLKILENE